jgi:deoxyribonuclease-4
VIPVKKGRVRPLRWTVPRRPLGAHMSIAGGLEKALERGAALGCTAIQLFTKSNNQWAARAIDAGEARRFREALAATGLSHLVAHDSYLINLCSPDDALWRKSIDACALELERCALLGVPWLVIHPGAHMGSGEDAATRRMAEAIDAVHARVPRALASLAIETAAGQGTTIGFRFEHLAAVVAKTRDPDRVGICLDTCHVFAAGYDLRTRRGYAETLRRLDGEVGLARLVAVHVNDSKRECGSRVDRHEHIGRGHLGREAFRWLMNDERLRGVPLVLETPKDDAGREDVKNLTALLKLVDGAA